MKKGQRKWLAVAVALTVAFGGAQLLRPVGEQIVGPIVQEQLNTAINGTAAYKSFKIGWDGTVHIDDLQIKDAQGALVAEVPLVDVSLDVLEALKLPVNQTSPLRLIHSVTLTDSIVYAVETSENTWNVTSLIKHSSNDEPMEFRGHIILNNGVAKLSWLNGRKTSVTAINGGVKLGSYPVIDGVLSASIDEQPITINASYTNDKSADFSLFIKSPALALTYINDLIPRDINAQIVGGTAENVALTINRKAGALTYEGALDITHLAVNYRNPSIGAMPYEIRQGAGHVNFDGTKITLADGRVVINEQALFAHGTVDVTDSESPELNLTLRGQAVKIEALLDKGITGSVDGVAHVYGTFTDPLVNATIEANRVNYEGYVLQKGLATLAYSNDVLDISDIQLALNGGEASGRGQYNLKSQDYELSFEGRNIPLGLVGQAIGEPLHGLVRGKAYVKGNIETAAPTVSATFEGQGIGYETITTDTLSGQIDGVDGQYTINYLNGTIGEGSFTAYGTATTNSLGLKFNAKDIPLHIFSNYVKRSMDGTGTLSGTIDGSLDNPVVVATVASNGGHIGSIRFDNAYADIQMNNKLVTIADGFIQDGHGYYNVAGTVDLGASQALNLQAGANTVRIENVAQEMVPDLPITGWLNLRTDIKGTLANPQIRGFVHAWDGSVKGKLFSDVHFAFRYEEQVFGIRELMAQAYGATFRGNGIYKAGNLNFRFLGDTIYLRPWLKEYAQVDGYITVEGTLTGTLDKPIVQGTLGSGEISVNGMSLRHVAGGIYADPTVIHLDTVSFEEGEQGKFLIDGGVTLDSNQRLFGYATVANGELANFLRVANIDVPNTKGFINGRLDLGGTLEHPDMTLTGTINDIIVGDNLWGTANLEMTLEDKKITIKKGELPIGSGMLAAVGTVDLNGESDIQIAGNKVAIESLLPLMKEPIDASGNIHFIANVTGKTVSPHVELSAELASASYNGVAFDRVYALATMEDKVIHLQQAVAQRGDYKAKLRGTVPLAAFYTSGYLPAGDTSAMDLTFDVNEADLDVLPLMFPAITEGSGPLKGTLHITGTYDQPLVNGTISVDNGLIHFDGVKKDLTDVSAQLIFKDRKAELIGGAAMGKGTVGLSGEVSWQGTSLINYAGVLQLNNLEVEHEYFKGPLNGEVGIVLRDGLPTVVGHLDLEKDTLTIPLSLTTTEGNTPMGLDFTVNVGKKVRLYSGGLYDFTLGGGAHIGGTTAFPHVEGEFHVKEGTLKYLNNSFKITEGKADFMQGSFLPVLHVKAESRVRSYRVYMEVDGSVEQMDLKLTSDPHLDERQIVSLLTFGYSSGNDSSVSSEHANALLAASVRSALLGYIEGPLKDTFGLDLINITTGSIDPNEPINSETNSYYNIEIGKYLLPNLMVTYSQGLNNDLQSYGILYDINNHFSINGWVSSNDHSYVGGQWTYEF